jgi:hypothetical protein
MFTVFVTWVDAPKRSERLANGSTTKRKIHASMFQTREEARRAAEQSLEGIPAVLAWRVAPF